MHPVQLSKEHWHPDHLPGAEEYDRTRNPDDQDLGPESVLRRWQDVPRPGTWENDPAETARRIWEWWRKLLLERRDAQKHRDMPHWFEAVRLVAIVQPSSAAAKRVFRVFKRVCKECDGDELGRPTLELRILAQTYHEMLPF